MTERLRRFASVFAVLASGLGCGLTPFAFANESKSALIRSGRFAPLFGLDPSVKDLAIQSFRIDRLPVTQADYVRFLESYPKWRRGSVSLTFADSGYLKDWQPSGSDGWSPLATTLQSPVVNVSWFAAFAYCEAMGGRLPTVLEWEYVAAADEKRRNALKDPKFRERILRWYSTPQKTLPEVGKGKPNYWGIYDLHGLIWEWTSDFNSVFVSGDNRQDGDKTSDLTCGNGATGSSSRTDYAAFMRYAMRSSLKADHTTSNLGFRCAYDLKGVKR